MRSLEDENLPKRLTFASTLSIPTLRRKNEQDKRKFRLTLAKAIRTSGRLTSPPPTSPHMTTQQQQSLLPRLPRLPPRLTSSHSPPGAPAEYPWTSAIRYSLSLYPCHDPLRPRLSPLLLSPPPPALRSPPPRRLFVHALPHPTVLLPEPYCIGAYEWYSQSSSKRLTREERPPGVRREGRV